MACIGLEKHPSNHTVAALKLHLDVDSWDKKLAVCRTLVALGEVDDRLLTILTDMNRIYKTSKNNRDVIMENIIKNAGLTHNNISEVLKNAKLIFDEHTYRKNW